MADDEEKITLINMWENINDDLDDIYESNKEEIDKIMPNTNNDKKLSILRYVVEVDILYEKEKHMVENDDFIKQMLNREDDSTMAITIALYQTSNVINGRELKQMETKIIEKFQDGDLLNLTKTVDHAVCPRIVGDNVFDEKGNIIPHDKLFEYKHNCYNIDDLLEHSKVGVIETDLSLEKTIITDHVDMSNQNFNDETLKLAVFPTKVISINLSNNSLIRLKGLVIPEGTKKLDLSNNPIIEIVADLPSGLETLVLTNTSMDSFSPKSNLKHLTLDECRSLKLLDLSGLVNLETLDISNCPILNKVILPKNLSKVKKIIAKNNCLMKLEINNIASLTYIDLSGNHKIDQLTLRGHGKLPKLECDNCNILRIENNDLLNSVGPSNFPKNVDMVQYINNKSLELKVGSMSSIVNLKKLIIRSCPKITSLTNGAFNSNVASVKGNKLVVKSDSKISFRPQSAFIFSDLFANEYLESE